MSSWVSKHCHCGFSVFEFYMKVEIHWCLYYSWRCWKASAYLDICCWSNWSAWVLAILMLTVQQIMIMSPACICWKWFHLQECFSLSLDILCHTLQWYPLAGMIRTPVHAVSSATLHGLQRTWPMKQPMILNWGSVLKIHLHLQMFHLNSLNSMSSKQLSHFLTNGYSFSEPVIISNFLCGMCMALTWTEFLILYAS